MFERFTDRARKVMALANQEAQSLNHDYIGTEHILLGLVKEGSGIGAKVLKNLGADLRKVRREVKKIVPVGADMVTMGKLPQTPRGKRVIEFAIHEARNLGHNYVGTEHMLLGLLSESEGVAAQVLLNLEIKLEDARVEVLKLVGAGIEPFDMPAADPETTSDEEPPSRDVAAWLFARIFDELGRLKDEQVRAANYEQAAELRDLSESLRDVRDRLLAKYKS